MDSPREPRTAPVPPGGAGSTPCDTAPPASEPSGGIDATNIKDQAAIRRARKCWPKRWAGISDEKKQKWLDQLEKAGDVANQVLAKPTRLITDMDGRTAEVIDSEIALKAVNAVVSVVKTAAVIEGQNQADDHMEVKLDNPGADAGTGGPAVVFNIVLATPPAHAARPAPTHEPIVLPSPNDDQARHRPAPEAG